jgi:hypothetical protein
MTVSWQFCMTHMCCMCIPHVPRWSRCMRLEHKWCGPRAPTRATHPPSGPSYITLFCGHRLQMGAALGP